MKSDMSEQEPGHKLDIEQLLRENEQLRKENERLSKLNSQTRQQGRAASPRARNGWALVLVALGCILAALAVTAVWLNRTVMDTDTWVATMAPLASEPSFQGYVADTATNAIFDNVDVETYVEQRLPDRAKPLSAPISNTVQNFVHTQAQDFSKTSQFEQLWIQINRSGHQAVIAAITGREGALSTNNGVVTLNIGLLITKLKERLAARGLDIVNRIPTASLNREIVIMNSPALAQANSALSLMNRLAIALPLLALALLFGAVALAKDRRRILFWLGLGLVLAMILPLEALYLAQYPFAQALSEQGRVPNTLGIVLFNTIFAGLFNAQRLMIVVGFIIFVGAVLAGPTSWAVALRRSIQNGIQGMGTGWDFGAFGEWVLGHKSLLRTVGFILAAVVLLLPVQRTLTYVLSIPVILIVWLLLIELFGRPSPQTRAETPSTVETEQQPGKKYPAA